MKRTFVKMVSTKVLAAVLLSGSVLLAAPVTGKATPRTIEIISPATQATVQFAGAADNALYFNVKVANANGDKFTITVTDKEGDVLYTNEFSEKNFDKKFKLLKSDDISAYNFRITSSNKSLDQTFSVSATTKVVDDVTVTKL
ncbi:MAG TPA: hypothetical protein VG738_16240 [Chitinophagaceae bacterium]|nr:hypothetical protein [Chitinophagaceae bacterium]